MTPRQHCQPTSHPSKAVLPMAFHFPNGLRIHARPRPTFIQATSQTPLRAIVHPRRLHPRCGIERPERYDATDWARALGTLPRSEILRRIRGHIIANSVVASTVLVLFDVLAKYKPELVHHFNITPLPHTFLVTAMSLLLVFRSNAAYVG